VEQGTHNGSNHVLKESVTADPEDPLVSPALPFRFENDSYAIFHFACRRTEGCKIVLSDEATAGFIDRGLTHCVRKGVDVPTIKWTDDVLPPYVVFVGL